MAASIIVRFPTEPVEQFRSASSLSELRAVSTVDFETGTTILLEGEASQGDGKGGTYVWIADSLAADNYPSVIRPDDKTPLEAGRWLPADNAQAAFQNPDGAYAIGYGPSSVGDALDTTETGLATVQTTLAAVEGLVSEGTRAAPHADFAWVPILPSLSPAGLSYTDSPLAYAKRTRTITQDTERLYVAANGDDTTGAGTVTLPFRTIQKALEYTGATTISVGPGTYPPFNLRRDTYPALYNRLRVIEATGPVTIAWPADDLTNKPTSATGTVTFAGIPADADFVEVNGVRFTFKTTPTGPFDMALGASANAAAANLAAAINRFTSLVNVTASAPAAVVTLTSTLYGAAGNATTLAETAANITVSGATLAGGANTWTAGSFNTYSYSLTPANKPPRAVLDKSKIHPETGMGTPLVRYANSRTLTFTGQPVAGNTVTINGTVFTFSNSAVGSNQVQIGATFADTRDNLLAKINALTQTVGVVADKMRSNPSVFVRIMARMGSSDTITASASGAQPAVGAQVSGFDELSNLSLIPDPNVVAKGPTADIGGWYYDSATNKLHVRIRSENIENYRANLKLITTENGVNNRCFVYGAMLGLKGDIQFEGTYPFLLDQGGNRPELWAEITNPYGRVAAVCTAMGVGFLENQGGLAVIQGATGYCCSLDTFHPTAGTVGASTLLIECGSYFAGDQFTFPVVEFPNRNFASSHGSTGAMAIFGKGGQNSNGPEIAGEGKYWLVATHGNNSIGVGNEYGLLAILGSTYYVDSCGFQGNAIADIGAQNNSTIHAFNTAYRTTAIDSGSTLNTSWKPPLA